jgi:hypothetical protein
MTTKPTFGQANLAALIALAVGSIFGLFALGSIPAVVARDLQFLAVAPTMNIISFFACGAVGWLLGGQIGPLLEKPLGIRRGQIVGGVIGGLVPVAIVAGYGWYLATQPA